MRASSALFSNARNVSVLGAAAAGSEVRAVDIGAMPHIVSATTAVTINREFRESGFIGFSSAACDSKMLQVGVSGFARSQRHRANALEFSCGSPQLTRACYVCSVQ